MAMRKPLSVRNSEDPGHRKPNAGKGKKARPHYLVLDRPTIVSQLNIVLKDSVGGIGPAKISEEDLKDPTAERAQTIYFRVLQYSFGITVDSLTQAPFSAASTVVHKELMEDFTYRIQFFRCMKRLMQTCLEENFTMRDLLVPDSKRLCRHISAFLNYTKYHHGVFSADDAIGGLLEEKEVQQESISQDLEINRDANTKLSALEKQRTEEHHLEEELKVQISSQRQSMQELKSREEYLKQQYQADCEEKNGSDQKLGKLAKEVEKFSLRVDDLMKQVVTSPDKLKANLSRLKQEVKKANATSQDSNDLLRMWESLASRADQIPGGVLEVVGKNLDALADKVKRRNELLRDYESKEEEIIRQQQALQETTDKHLNLQKHLKSVREDSNAAAFQQPEGQSNGNQALHRDILLLQQEVRLRDMESEKKLLEMEAERAKIAKYREAMKTAYLEMEELTNSLLKAFHSKADQYKDTMKSLGVDIPS